MAMSMDIYHKGREYVSQLLRTEVPCDPLYKSTLKIAWRGSFRSLVAVTCVLIITLDFYDTNAKHGLFWGAHFRLTTSVFSANNLLMLSRSAKANILQKFQFNSP